MAVAYRVVQPPAQVTGDAVLSCEDCAGERAAGDPAALLREPRAKLMDGAELRDEQVDEFDEFVCFGDARVGLVGRGPGRWKRRTASPR